MVDADKARRLLNVLLDALADLGRYRLTLSRETLQSSHDAQHMVLHALYVAVQASVHLALHLGVESRAGQSATYQAAFHRLADLGVLEREHSKRLAAWAGFRNVLAHFYAVIDYDRVYAALGELGDLDELARVVSERLEGSGD